MQDPSVQALLFTKINFTGREFYCEGNISLPILAFIVCSNLYCCNTNIYY